MWSPDGTQLRFVAVGNGLDGTRSSGRQLVVAGADGSAPKVIAEMGTSGGALGCGSQAGGLAWTSDDRIWRTGYLPRPTSDLLIESMRPDGTDVRVERRIAGTAQAQPCRST